MSSNAGGPCLVCGKKSTNRCSNCAKASIDLFFCSTAHQKLAWWAHKIVCGPGKANPFRQPYLTADEAEDALVHEASPVAELDGKSLAETFEHFLRPEDIGSLTLTAVCLDSP
ncbi:hypothetical protein DMC30DRAFT_133522 [Rhodotorula diobovata]|uniref:MYND-type domain-containing protein n=1 Tax=Rhodotorula diobovata TaxID=5288 RepID=A0A5C5FKC6_9BASI|nr:hypothetical protein DMC30DRAFT_133522 [Rhodotorula diobovata]